MKRLLIIINKQKIFLDKIKRTGSNLKKKSEFYKDCIEACIQPLICKCYKFKQLSEVLYSKGIWVLYYIVLYAGKEKSIAFSSFFHTIKARKS